MIQDGIIVKSPQEISLMRDSGRITAEVLAVLAEKIRPGMTTAELDAIAAKEIKARKAVSAFKGYRGYPAHICVSVNDEVVHGIPGNRFLREGDVVSMDAGVIYQGFQSDSAITVALGDVPLKVRELIDVTRESLMKGIAMAREGARVGDISWAVQEWVEAKGLGVVREYVGHGIGRNLHEAPQVPNFGPPGKGPLLRRGVAIAIEPMVTMGDWHTKVGPDNWTVYTTDGSIAAHFEHTIAITNGSAEVLTQL